MTFLNWAMLAGMAVVAIPIIIHLLNRRRATVVDWGAMRFLLDSLTSRRWSWRWPGRSCRAARRFPGRWCCRRSLRP